MVPEDDGRSTIEIDDRYMILPAGWSHEPFLKTGGVPVPDGFYYASNTNPERLDARGLQQLLAQCFT
jgi:UDP-N-acetylglucosamine 4,6-dehydratase